MWFDASTESFRKTAIAALSLAGYRPILVDQEHYTGFIVDRIVTGIREARFLIADLTAAREDDSGESKTRGGTRGGVYWEAGMAFGLKKPVIHTCRNDRDSKRRTHFDLKQYNTMFWKPEELGTDIREDPGVNPTFAEELYQRILAVVGRGGYRPE